MNRREFMMAAATVAVAGCVSTNATTAKATSTAHGVNGVKAHLKVIYTHLGAASRTEATSLAINLRLISV